MCGRSKVQEKTLVQAEGRSYKEASDHDSEATATASPVEEVPSFRSCSSQHPPTEKPGLGDSHTTINSDAFTKGSRADFDDLLWDEDFPKRKSEKQDLLDSLPADAQALTRSMQSPEEICLLRSPSLGGLKLTDTIAQVLEMGVEATYADKGLTRRKIAPDFDGEGRPSLPLWAYLRRLHRDIRCGDATFICAMVLLDRALGDGTTRVLLGRKYLALTERNVHRLFLTALLIATKTLLDTTWKNSQFARLGGITVSELNKYELAFLKLIKFNTVVRVEEYQLYHKKLSAQALETRPSCFAGFLSCFAWLLP
nr:cyclin-1 [Crypthecodinium cohnii]